MGIHKLKDTIKAVFHAPKLRSSIKTFIKKCSTCQKYKKCRKKYSKLPAKKAEVIPWETIYVDLIGLFTIKTANGKKSLHCLTILDLANYWIEITEIRNKTSKEIALQFNIEWIAYYPYPTYYIFDKGSEFIGKEF